MHRLYTDPALCVRAGHRLRQPILDVNGPPRAVPRVVRRPTRLVARHFSEAPSFAQGVRMHHPGGTVLVIQRYLLGAVPGRCLWCSHRQASAPQPRVLRACRRRIAWACLLRHEDGQAPCCSVIALCVISAARGRL